MITGLPTILLLLEKHNGVMRDDPFCHCGSCGHEKVEECYTKQCQCCLTDHQGSFAKNK